MMPRHHHHSYYSKLCVKAERITKQVASIVLVYFVNFGYDESTYCWCVFDCDFIVMWWTATSSSLHKVAACINVAVQHFWVGWLEVFKMKDSEGGGRGTTHEEMMLRWTVTIVKNNWITLLNFWKAFHHQAQSDVYSNHPTSPLPYLSSRPPSLLLTPDLFVVHVVSIYPSWDLDKILNDWCFNIILSCVLVGCLCFFFKGVC